VASNAQRASWKEWRRRSGGAGRLAAARAGPCSRASFPRASVATSIGSRSAQSITAQSSSRPPTLWGATKFSTDPKSHGLQLAHQMVLTQWQMKNGQLVKEVIWPLAAATAPVAYPYH